MKILHVTTGLENAGAEAVLFRLISGDAQPSRHEVISLTGRGFYAEHLERRGVRVHALDLPRGRVRLAALLRLYRLIRTIKPDVVQSWMYHADLLGGVLARLAGVRVVVWGIHHSNLDAGKNLRRTIVIARVCAWLSHVVPRHIIACSERAAQVHSSLGYCARKMRVVHNCADVHQFAPDSLARTKIRAAMKIGPAETLLGMVARWDPHKDHANLIAAMERVKAVAAVPWRLVLIGAGMTPENRELTALIVAHGVEECVVLAGPRNDVPAVMNALDLHVLSSSGEAFGNVTIEAMACGVPAVVTSVGAGETIVGETGWVVPPSDPAALSQAVLLAMQEMATAESWQARRTDCRTRVVQHFSLERMINGYQLVWTAAVS